VNHLTEEQLLLHHYGEPVEGFVPAHLSACERCRAEQRALVESLQPFAAMPVPEPEPEYEAALWRRLSPRLGAEAEPAAPPARSWLPAGGWGRLMAARPGLAWAALAMLVVGSFLAGRFMAPGTPQAPGPAAPHAPERIVIVAIGEHLERSLVVLAELVNAPDGATLDVAGLPDGAEDLVRTNRLYRSTAAATGETALAGVLEDLERVLVELANAPGDPADLDDLRDRIGATGLVFKIRVMTAQIRSRERTLVATNAAS
jgi:hypothetical protein